MKLIMSLCTLLILAFPAFAVKAQSVSGELTVLSRYLDNNLFVLTNEPVIQASLYVDVSEKCSIDLWANQGLNTSVGAEIDVGISCRSEIGTVEVEVSVGRYLLRGENDITGLNISLTRGKLDLTISQYLWDSNPNATRLILGYTVEVSESLTLHPTVGYETGFSKANIYVFGLSAEYAFSDSWYLVGTVLTPISKGEGDERSTETSLGIMFTF